MKNPIVIVIALLVVVLGGVGVYTLLNQTEPEAMMQKDESAMMKTDTTTQAQKTMENPEDLMLEQEQKVMAEGTLRYLPHSPEALSSTIDTKRVLFFYANWCPTCRPADADFSQNESRIPKDVTVIRVNYNDTETDQAEKDLAAQYGITYQHTYVQIDAAGNEIEKWNGGAVDELLEKLQ